MNESLSAFVKKHRHELPWHPVVRGMLAIPVSQGDARVLDDLDRKVRCRKSRASNEFILVSAVKNPRGGFQLIERIPSGASCCRKWKGICKVPTVNFNRRKSPML